MKRILQLLSVAAVAVGLTATVHALPTLYLSSDGTTWTTAAVDNGAGDLNGATGQVTFIGGFGAFNLNVHTGTTYPVLGSLSNPVMDLSYNTTSSAAGTIYIAFSADGFGPTAGTVQAQIGGTLIPPGTSIWYMTYGGNSNTLRDLSQLNTTLGAFTNSPYSGAVTGPAISNNGPYSLTQVLKITATAGSQNITGDALLTVPDAGTTVMLLGAGLTALGLFGRIRRRLA